MTDPLAEAVARARATLRAGGLALVPTDTVYGLAAALDSQEGVAALYAHKGRPRSQPCQVLLLAPAALAAALEGLDPAIARAAAAVLPGPATCIVPDRAGRYAAAAGEAAGSVGIRAPRMEGPVAGLDIPLVATSANHPGGPDPARVAEVPADLRAGVAILDAGTLPGTASAVVDLRPVPSGGPAPLLRPGPDPEALERALTAVGVRVSRPS